MKPASRAIGVSAVFTLLSAGGWLACSGDDNTTPTADSGTPDSSVVDSGTKPDTGVVDSGAPDTSKPDTGVVDSGVDAADAGDAGDGAAEAGDGGPCATYCAAIMAVCTGANAQYSSMRECMNVCALLPAGDAGDTSGDTMACRFYHTALAADAGANPHCWHAGPYGYGGDAGAGCGDPCGAFCTLATDWCSPDAGYDAGPDAEAGTPYPSAAACETSCASFTKLALGADGGFNAAGPTAGNTFDCRQYHLGAALDDTPGGGSQHLHCGHVGATSPVCQ